MSHITYSGKYCRDRLRTVPSTMACVLYDGLCLNKEQQQQQKAKKKQKQKQQNEKQKSKKKTRNIYV